MSNLSKSDQPDLRQIYRVIIYGTFLQTTRLLEMALQVLYLLNLVL